MDCRWLGKFYIVEEHLPIRSFFFFFFILNEKEREIFQIVYYNLII